MSKPLCSIYLTATGKLTGGSSITTRFDQALDLSDQGKCYIAMCQANISFSCYNVSTSNNHFRYNNGAINRDVNLQSGFYTVKGIAQAIYTLISDLGDDPESILMKGNTFTNRVEISLLNGYSIDFRVSNNMGQLLGFQNQVVAGNQLHVAPNDADMTLGVSTYFINIDLIENSYINGTKSPAIVAFQFGGSPNTLYTLNNFMKIYLPLNNNRIQSFNVWITDNNGKVVDFNNEQHSFTFHITNQPK